MVLRSCQCLNVRVNVIEKQSQDGAAYIQMDLGMGGIKVMHTKLVSVRPHGSQRIFHCGNCSFDVLMIGPKGGNENPFGGEDADKEEDLKKIFEHKGPILLNQNCLTELGMSEAKLKDSYSEVFYIVMNDELSNQKNSLTELSLDKEYHDTLLALHHQVTVEFSKRKKDIKDRLRKFEEEQIKEYNAQQARAHLDRQKLWNTICVVNQESLTFKKRTQSVPQPVKYGEDPLTGFSEQRGKKEREVPFQPGSMASPLQIQSKAGQAEKLNPAQAPRPAMTYPIQSPAPATANTKAGSTSTSTSTPNSAASQPTSASKPGAGKTAKKAPTGEAKKKVSAKTKRGADTLFQLEGFEDDEEEDDEEEEEEEEEEEPEEQPLRNNNNTNNNNLYSSSVPVSIPGRNFVPLQMDPLNDEVVDDDEAKNEPFEAPHIFLAKSYAADSREIFGERPRKMNFSLGI